MAPPSSASTTLVATSKQGEEEDVDLDSSLIWAIRYLECEAVEEMLAEGAPAARNCSLQRVGVRGTAQPEMGCVPTTALLVSLHSPSPGGSGWGVR